MFVENKRRVELRVMMFNPPAAPSPPDLDRRSGACGASGLSAQRSARAFYLFANFLTSPVRTHSYNMISLWIVVCLLLYDNAGS